MTLATRWIHKIDGTDISDGIDFATSVPDAEAEFGATVLTTDMQARTPVFNRQQPVAGRFTFLITIVSHSDAEYLANLATLRALVALKEAGATILPASPGFYSRPATIEELVDQIVARILDRLGLSMPGARRWEERGEE